MAHVTVRLHRKNGHWTWVAHLTSQPHTAPGDIVAIGAKNYDTDTAAIAVVESLFLDDASVDIEKG